MSGRDHSGGQDGEGHSRQWEWQESRWRRETAVSVCVHTRRCSQLEAVRASGAPPSEGRAPTLPEGEVGGPIPDAGFFLPILASARWGVGGMSWRPRLEPVGTRKLELYFIKKWAKL